MQEIISGDLKQNPKRFYSYMKRKRQESEGVLFLIDKNGFLQSDSTKRADILNDQFVSAYTRADILTASHRKGLVHILQCKGSWLPLMESLSFYGN